VTILIFGDSFSETAENHNYNNKTDYSWPQLLEKETDENIINYSKGSTGPYYSMSKLYEHIDTFNLNQDDKIVFMLSSQYRIPFSFIDTLHLQELADFYTYTRKLENSREYFNDFSYELWLVYKTLRDEIELTNYKNISFLKSLSITKKVKIIVFLCYSHYGFFTYEENYKDPYIEKFNFCDLNDENFKLFEKPLDFVSLEENTIRKNIDTADNNKPNHLDWYNHVILKNIIVNFFYKKEYDENFKKNYIRIKNEYESNPYIYE